MTEKKPDNILTIKIGLLALAALSVVPFLVLTNDADTNSSVISISETSLLQSASADVPVTHDITMIAESLPNGQLAYRMVEHTITDPSGLVTSVTEQRYGATPVASIPGPTIIVNEGDEVFLTLQNGLGSDCVSVHVHGIHYAIESDGTLESVNGVIDSCATVSDPFVYHWTAAKGTSGTWPYHDHTFGGELGAEDKGLYGTLIVNKQGNSVQAFIDGELKHISSNKIQKEYVLWMVGTQFNGMEIDHKNGGLQTPLWINPTLVAKQNDIVRFHVIGLGTQFHTFHMHAHRWQDPGTTDSIDTKTIGPLTRHVFTAKAGEGVGSGDWMYHCHVFAHMQAGMSGIFRVTTDGGPSIPGPAPFDTVSFEIVDEPGPWFRNLAPLAGTSESIAIAKPGDFVSFQMTDTNTVHTVTSLLYPVATAGGSDADNMPFDQSEAFSGGAVVQLNDPGLYAFTCKVHPYMFAAVIVDDPATTGLDLGENIRLVNGIEVPTLSDLAVRLVKTVFVVTDPNNWQDYDSGTWNVFVPPVEVRVTGGVTAFLDTLIPDPAAPLVATPPATPGIGEVWVNTQFEKTDGKSKFGSASAVDASTWEVTKKISQPGINMNHPHNMWTDETQDVIYQTQWFDNRLAVFDREDGSLITDFAVGDAPSHVMTNPTTGTLYIAMNGDNSDNSVVTVNPSTFATGSVDIEEPHPHGHWISSDGTSMVTPNAFTGTSSIYDFATGITTVIPASDLLAVSTNAAGIPIATGMHPSGDKYYVANLLDQTLTCVSIGAAACVDGASIVDVKPIVLIAGYDPVSGSVAPGSFIGGLPIQTPVSPDGRYIVTANVLLPSITVVDTSTDELVAMLPCDAGCHGVQWGAKVVDINGDGTPEADEYPYYAYVANKFSNVLIVVNPDPDNNGDASDATIAGKVVLSTSNLATGAVTDDTVNALDGMGGQGTLPIPNVYDGWIEETVAACLTVPGTCDADVEAWLNALSADQQDPYP